MKIIALIANQFIWCKFLSELMSSGRTGPYFLTSKSMQKTPKDFPSFGFLPCLGPQAKARESDARFRSPALSVQIWKQSRAEPGLRHCSPLARIKIPCQNSAHCECNGQYGSFRSVATRTAVARTLGRGFSRGLSPWMSFVYFSTWKSSYRE